MKDLTWVIRGIMSPEKSHVVTLVAQNVTILGDRAFNEVRKVK